MTAIDEQGNQIVQCARCRIVGVKGETCSRGCGRLGDAPGMAPDVTVDALAIAHAQIERLAAGIEEARRHYREQLAALEIERNEAVQALGALRLEALGTAEVLQAQIGALQGRCRAARDYLVPAKRWAFHHAPVVAENIAQALKELGLDE